MEDGVLLYLVTDIPNRTLDEKNGVAKLKGEEKKKKKREGEPQSI